MPGRLALFAVGVPVGGASVGLLLRAELGVSSYDVLNSGLAGTVGIPVGTASWIVSGVVILVALALGRRPGPGTLVSLLGFGAMINLVLDRVDTPDGLALRVLWLVVALLGLWSGIALIVVARVGANPPEELMLGLVGRGLSVRAARWGIEAVLLVLGVALGGQLGIGTVIIAVCTAPVLGFVLPRLERRLHEPIHVEVFPAP
jgi:uncharacterized membrane protein YczE